MPQDRVQRRLAAILAADVAGYSRLMGDDEAGTLAELKQHLSQLIRPTIADHRGRVVKTTGDGLLAEFASAVDAVWCAREIQAQMAGRNAGVEERRRIDFRIGVNVGDIIADGDDIFGDGVNVAARLEGLCRPGRICVSGTVYDQVHGKVDCAFRSLGARSLKNIDEPVRVYEMTDAGDRAGALHRQTSGRFDARRWFAAIAAAALAGIAVIVLWPVRAPEPLPPQAPAPVTTADPVAVRRSVSVLPLANSARETLESWVVQGFRQDLVAALGKIAGLFVVEPGPRGRAVKDNRDLREIGRKLGVGHLLSGRVAGSREALAVFITMVDSQSDEAIWTGQFDVTPERRFAIIAEIAGAVAGALSVPVSADELARLAHRPTADGATYDLFLRARAAEAEAASDPERLIQARDLYRQVTALDPAFAGGFAGFASTLARSAAAGRSKAPKEDLAKALELARTALRLDPDSTTARQVLAFAEVADGRLDAAVSTYERTIALEPSNAAAHAGLGITLAYAGRPEEGAAELKEAIDLNPADRDAPYRKLLGVAYFAAGYFAEAVDVWEENEAAKGSDPTLLAALSTALAELGRDDASEAARAELLAATPDYRASNDPLFRLFVPAERERLLGLLVNSGLPE